MSWIVIVIIVGLISGIVYISWKPAAKPKSRREFFENLTKYMHGEQTAMEGVPDGIQVKFTYEGHTFVYEEIETLGFKQSAYKGFLKLKMDVPVTIYFTERKAQKIVRSGFDTANQMKDRPVNLPPSLHAYNGYSSDADLATEFFKDPALEKIWNDYKSLDMNGYPYMPLKIQNGEIVLEFHSAGQVNPTLQEIRSDVPSIERHLDRLLLISGKIKTLSERSKFFG